MLKKKKKVKKRNTNVNQPEQMGFTDQDDGVRLYPLSRSPETHFLEAFLLE